MPFTIKDSKLERDLDRLRAKRRVKVSRTALAHGVLRAVLALTDAQANALIDGSAVVFPHSDPTPRPAPSESMSSTPPQVG